MRRFSILSVVIFRAHFYAVRVGRRPGVFLTWDQAKAEIHRWPEAEHKRFKTFQEAIEYLQTKHKISPPETLPEAFPFLLYSPPLQKSPDSVSSIDDQSSHLVPEAGESFLSPEEPEKTPDLKEDPESLAKDQVYLLYADGGSRGNPGISGAGFVIYSCDGKKVAEEAVPLGNKTTNNEAEYLALLLGLQQAKVLDIQKIRVLMDSKLVVNQCKQVWNVYQPHLIKLNDLVKKEIEHFEKFSISYIPRNKNSVADALANKAMDEAESQKV